MKILQNPKDYAKSDLPAIYKVAPANAPAPNGLSFLETLKKFEKNKTTYNEVIRELGEPISIKIASDTGAKSIYYGGTAAPYNPVTSIPVEALFEPKPLCRKFMLGSSFSTKVICWSE